MQTASSSGLLFCPYTGSMLVFDPLKNIASSKLSGYTRQLDGEHGGCFCRAACFDADCGSSLLHTHHS